VRSDFDKKLNLTIARASHVLMEHQHPDGYWCFELEADCTIPAEYILMMHFMGEIDEDIEAKIAVYLRTHQCEDGGWNLFYGGDSELSCSVKVYYALKLAGDSPDAPHIVKAREWITHSEGQGMDHGPPGCSPCQYVDPLYSCTFWSDFVEMRAFSAGGNYVYAPVVSLSFQ